MLSDNVTDYNLFAFVFIAESMWVTDIGKRSEGAIRKVLYIVPRFCLTHFLLSPMINDHHRIFSMQKVIRSKERKAMQVCRDHKSLQVRNSF